MNRQVRDAYWAVGLGGALGALLRFAVLSLAPASWNLVGPWLLVAVNVSGSAALALVLVYGERNFEFGHRFHHLWRPFLATGVLGGYTTTSSYALLSVEQFNSGEYQQFLMFAFGSVVLALGAFWIAHAFAVRWFVERSERS